MTQLEVDNHREQLALDAAFALARLTDAAIYYLPLETQSQIDAVVRAGGTLGVFVILNPVPTFIGTLSAGPDNDPIELFRVEVARDSLRAPTGVGH